jgi:hypothetical protein
MKKPSAREIKAMMLEPGLEADIPEDRQEEASARAKTLGLSLKGYTLALMLDGYLRAQQQQAAGN